MQHAFTDNNYFSQPVLLVDNYDSFTYNLVQLLNEAGAKSVDIVPNDKIRMNHVAKYRKIMFSPGAGLPNEYPAMKHILEQFAQTKSILGICLGHQAIAEYFGAKLINLPSVFHGVKSQIEICNPTCYLFEGISETFQAGLYHSWAVNEHEFPNELYISAKSKNEIIMAISHKKFDVNGIQFHPESYMTTNGITLIKNWLKKQ